MQFSNKLVVRGVGVGGNNNESKQSIREIGGEGGGMLFHPVDTTRVNDERVKKVCQ